MPGGVGLRPALRLLPTERSRPPGIDIAEMLGGGSRVAAAALHPTHADRVRRAPHGCDNGTTDDHATGAGDLSRGLRRRAPDRQPGTVAVLPDDGIVARWTTPRDMNKPFDLVVGLAVGNAGRSPGPPNRAARRPATPAIRPAKIWRHLP